MKRMLQEPLLHFLLLGAGLFLAYSLLAANAGAEPGKIVVTQGQVENLVAGFSKTWQRPPTAQELSGLIGDHVREEVYYREALALGLDQDDSVIRRRLRQKLEFVSEDIAAQAEPTDAELEGYLREHADAFRSEPTFSFSQVYLNPEKHGDLEREAAKLMSRLNQAGGTTDAAALGDPLLLEHSFAGATRSEVAARFGDRFAARLCELAPGRWQGPVESGYGAHLVLVSARDPGAAPALAQVRDAVLREWTDTRRSQAKERFYQSMLKHYVVTIEQPRPIEATGGLAIAQ